MAHELELEWWRPQEAEAESTQAADAGERGQAWLPFWCIMAFTGVLLLSPQNYFPVLQPLRPALLIIVIGLFSYVADRWSRGLPVISWTRETALIAALAGLAAITVPFSIWPGGSLASLFDYLKTVAVFLLLSHVITTMGLLRRAGWVLTIMAIGLALFYFYNFATGAFIDKGDNSDRLIGNEGALTKNPNDMALMVNLLLPLTVGLFLSSKRSWQRGFLFFAICMEAGTVILTYSRGGAVTLVAIMLLYIWKLRHKAERSLLYTVLLAGVLALPLLPSSYFERMSTITSMADRTGSAGERLSDLIIAVKTVVANPVLGAGIGMNMLAMREARGEWRQVHNVYLEHAIDLGLPGLVLFLALLTSCVQAVSRIQRLNVSPELSYLAQGIQVSLIAYAVAAMFHPVSYHYFFYYIAGLAIAARTIAEAQVGRTSEARA
jgi:probable O-glycosylation ligase (exosortase A-associated)